MSLTKKTGKGIIWSLMDGLFNKGFSAVVTFALSYFLLPADYGLLAMGAVFISLGQSLMQSGFQDALIRRQHVAQITYNTGFYSNIILGLISYFLIFISAPYIATFYNEEQLTAIIRVIGLSIIGSSFQIVQLANLHRNLDFKALIGVNVPSAIMSGIIAFFFAYNGFGVWALVFHVILNQFFVTLLLWRMNIWRPAVCYSFPEFKALYRFGYKLFISRILSIVTDSAAVIMIGKVFSISTLGAYYFSVKISDVLVNQLVVSIQKVTFPALAKIQTDKERLVRKYRELIVVMTTIYFPVVVCLALVLPVALEVILKSSYQDVPGFVSILFFAAVLYPLHAINLNILKVMDRSDLYLIVNVLKKASTLIILFATLSISIEAVLWGQVLNSVICYFINAAFSKRVLGYFISVQLKDFVPQLVLCLLIALVFKLTSEFILPNAISAPFMALAFAMIYMSTAYVLRLSFWKITQNYVISYARSSKASRA